ncbi:MAG: phosphatidate cytidylyltransferase [Planctomycetota bacterium]
MKEYLWEWRSAFSHPVTIGISAGVGALLVVVLLVIAMMPATVSLREELRKRCLSWGVMAPLLIGPVLAGPLWTMLMVCAIGVLCYREYARATGLFREKAVSAVVVLGIFLVTFAVVDHWYGFFVALFPLVVVLIAAAGIVKDRPSGYIQRVGLAVLGFMLFGCALGHLGYMANDRGYRPVVLMVILCVEMNDVFAFCAGKLLGRHHLAPNTSPNKTMEGSVGAVVLTTALTAFLGHFVFLGTPMDQPFRLVTLGFLVSVAGQLGDLMLSSIKRDIGIKDMGSVIPGHGGILDRFNSLLLVSPAVFHFVGFFVGFGLDRPGRILTGG